ncbi:MAG: L-ribulose-5-phosphate 3-epimerase [Acetanaerobacterium sp.]
MQSYLLGLYEKSMPGNLSIAEKLAETRNAGFDYMELSIDETDEKLARLQWSITEIHELCAAQARQGIPIKSICLSGHRRFPLGDPNPGVRQKSLKIMEQAIILAARLGVRVVQIAGYDVYYKQSSECTRADFAANLELSVQMAAREGVILAFETMETEFINTVAKAMTWVDAIRSPYLQVYPDVGNITNAMQQYNTSVLDDLAGGKGHLAAVHLKETRPGIFREVPYGEGHVDFYACAEKAIQLGVRMFVGEFWYTGQTNWRETLKESNAFLRDALYSGLCRVQPQSYKN